MVSLAYVAREAASKIPNSSGVSRMRRILWGASFCWLFIKTKHKVDETTTNVKEKITTLYISYTPHLEASFGKNNSDENSYQRYFHSRSFQSPQWVIKGRVGLKFKSTWDETSPLRFGDLVTVSDHEEHGNGQAIVYFYPVRYHTYQLIPVEGFLSPTIAPNYTPGWSLWRI